MTKYGRSAEEAAIADAVRKRVEGEEASPTNVAIAVKTADELSRDERVFEWPCDKRKAHAPHEVEVPGIMLPVDPPKPKMRDCPGVKAHPATQIGGNYNFW